jgi:hypothetical protein
MKRIVEIVQIWQKEEDQWLKDELEWKVLRGDSLKRVKEEDRTSKTVVQRKFVRKAKRTE